MIKCVVPLSGGKDSQLCLELALKEFAKDEIIAVFCDTGYEHPLTYQHIDYLESHFGIQLVRLHHKDSVYDLILKTGCFPTDRMRFCTSDLKIRRGKKFYTRLAAMQGVGFEVWYGMRLGESAQRNKRYSNRNSTDLYDPKEILDDYPKYLGQLGVCFRLPILDWEEEDVFEYLGNRINPLYNKGFDRVGCFPCLAGGLKRNPDADAQGKLAVQEGALYTSEDLAPCHICNI